MSAEAPKPTGMTAPVTPQEPQGCLPGFLRRLVVGTSEPQFISGSAPKLTQPPPGLENFSAGIKQGIDDHFASVRQQDLERRNAEAARLAIENGKQSIAVLRQLRVEEQAILSRERSIAEAADVLKNLRIAERLEYIRGAYWEGKGEVRPVAPGEYGERLGGFELVHEYPSFTKRVEQLFPGKFSYGVSNYRWWYEQRADSTSLRIIALTNSRLLIHSNLTSQMFEVDRLSGDLMRKSWGWGEDPRGMIGYESVDGQKIIVPTDLPDRETLLQKAITQEVVYRMTHKLLPSQLETAAKEEWLRHRYQQKKGFSSKVYHEQHPQTDHLTGS